MSYFSHCLPKTKNIQIFPLQFISQLFQPSCTINLSPLTTGLCCILHRKEAKTSNPLVRLCTVRLQSEWFRNMNQTIWWHCNHLLNNSILKSYHINLKYISDANWFLTGLYRVTSKRNEEFSQGHFVNIGEEAKSLNLYRHFVHNQQNVHLNKSTPCRSGNHGLSGDRHFWVHCSLTIDSATREKTPSPSRINKCLSLTIFCNPSLTASKV